MDSRIPNGVPRDDSGDSDWRANELGEIAKAAGKPKAKPQVKILIRK